MRRASAHHSPIGPAMRRTYPRELAEHALAQVIGDKAEQAYRRSDASERPNAFSAFSDDC
jgi:hypothetical protein